MTTLDLLDFKWESHLGRSEGYTCTNESLRFLQNKYYGLFYITVKGWDFKVMETSDFIVDYLNGKSLEQELIDALNLNLSTTTGIWNVNY